jgi:1,4-alpha-glucan branching enzyme
MVRLRWIFCFLLVSCGLSLQSEKSNSVRRSEARKSVVALEGASQRPGIGAIPFEGGTTFRLWAPHADSVSVIGDFNNWDDGANPLVTEGNGYFSADVLGVVSDNQYQFALQRGSDAFIKSDPNGRAMTDSAGPSLVVDHSAFGWTNDSFRPAPFNQQIIYEMHIGTFNDATVGGTGNWSTAMDRLDYLASVGVNMLEVLPPGQFPGSYSWGYSQWFPFAPASQYGSSNEMKAFVDAAHARGIGVIVDTVHNHYSTNTPLRCFDGECFSAQGIYFYTDWRLDSGFGPRPDYGRPQIRDYIVDNTLMWLNDYHADGLRWDSTLNIRTGVRAGVRTAIPDGWALLQRINNTVHAQSSEKIMVAEDLQNDARLTRSTPSGGAGFDSQWDPQFHGSLRAALITTTDSSRDMNSLRNAILHSYNGTASHRVIYTENHDEVSPHHRKNRLPTEISPSSPEDYWAKKRSTLGAGILMTSPGIPMLFMGQEFLETTGFPFQRAQAIDWTRPDRFSGILQMYRDLISLRKNSNGVSAGLTGNSTNVFHVNNQAKVISFHRWSAGGQGDDVVVVANFSNRAFPSYIIGFPRGGRWRVRFNSDWNGYSPDFGNTPSNDTTATQVPRDGLRFSGSVGFGPYTLIVLSQSRQPDGVTWLP